MEHLLDVSMLEPPQPMERVLEAIAQLGEGDILKVQHRREPRLLYPLLEKLGYTWHCEQQAEAQYLILIWLQHDVRAENKALTTPSTPSA